MTGRKITLVIVGPGGGWLEEQPQTSWQSFSQSQKRAEEILRERIADPLCNAIGYVVNGQQQGKWKLGFGLISFFPGEFCTSGVGCPD